MGNYVAELAIPANTPEDKPVETSLQIKGAVLTQIHFSIPPGHCGLARLAVYYGIKQIFPTEAGTWLSGDDESFSLKLNWPLPEREVTLALKGWNEDETYEHAFLCRFEVAEEVEEARPWRVISDFVAILKKLMGL